MPNGHGAENIEERLLQERDVEEGIAPHHEVQP